MRQPSEVLLGCRTGPVAPIGACQQKVPHQCVAMTDDVGVQGCSGPPGKSGCSFSASPRHHCGPRGERRACHKAAATSC
eukprot:1400764-Amphidinium_carterae.1